jgi:monoamine oxidase
LFAESQYPIESGVRQSTQLITRRDFIKGASVLGLAATGVFSSCRTANSISDPRIAIIGAGIAGLSACYQLKKAGIHSSIYEASSRTGGRMFSIRDAMGQGLVTEFGGEFIDTNHSDILDYVKEFGLELLDTSFGPALTPTFYFGGKYYTEKQIVAELKNIASVVMGDSSALGEHFNFRYPGTASLFDSTSLAEYINKLELSGWMKDLLTVAYVTEYGLDADEQSAINFLYLFDSEQTKDELRLFGESDERYKVKGGNQRIPDALAARLKDHIILGQKLEAISSSGSGYMLSIRSDNSTKDIEADIVILTIPFSVLRDVEIRVPLPDWKKNAINELGYGTSSKVMAGINGRPWEMRGASGEAFTDLSFQLAWDNAEFQDSPNGGLTFLTAGKEGIRLGEGTVKTIAEEYLKEFDTLIPGTYNARNEQYNRMHWPSYPFTKGAYACYKPGQWTSISGAEIEPIGNLYFAGEHCSRDFQGFMNGGAETGRRAAESIIKSLR